MVEQEKRKCRYPGAQKSYFWKGAPGNARWTAGPAQPWSRLIFLSHAFTPTISAITLSRLKKGKPRLHAIPGGGGLLNQSKISDDNRRTHFIFIKIKFVRIVEGRIPEN